MTPNEWLDLLLAVALIAVTLSAAVAIWRQARTSQAMVELNEQLAQTAKAALESSQRQAEAADRSIAESQRQAHLAAVPIPQVDQPEIRTRMDDQERITHFWTEITLRNGTVPALGVRLELTGAAQKGRVREQSAGAREWPVLAPGESVTLVADTRGCRLRIGSLDGPNARRPRRGSSSTI